MKVLVVFFVVFRKLLSFFGLGQGNCLYYPTCSEVVLSRLEEEGFFKTIPLVFKRVVMCNSIYRKFGKKWQ